MNRADVTKSHYLVLLGIVLAGVLLRGYYLHQPMRYDESLTFLRYASQPLETVVSSYEEPNNHVLHSVLVHAAYTVFGDEPWALRLPAFLAGVLLIPALYVVTRMFYTPRAGLLAAALCAVSLPLIEFSVNARGYTLLALIVVLLLIVARRLRERSTLVGWLLFSVLAALGFYTIPVMLYPFGIVALWLAISYQCEFAGWELLKRWIVLGVACAVGAALTLVLYLPVIATAGIGALTQNDFVTRPAASEFYQRLGEILRVLVEFPNLGVPWLLALVLFLSAGLATVLHKRLSRTRFSVGWAMLLWLALTLFTMRVIPFDRTWTTITPLYLMLAAAGIAWVVARSDVWFTAALLLFTLPTALNVVQSNDVLTSVRTGIAPDAEAAALWLSDHAQPGDIVLAPTPLDEPVRYYLRLHGDSPVSVRNQYQTSWVDLLQADVAHVYAFGVEDGDLDALLGAISLPAPSFNASLQPAVAFPQATLQELLLPRYGSGVLYSDDFEGATLFAGWTVHNVQAEVLKSGGNNQALTLATGESAGELVLSGADQWTDYTVDLRVRVLASNPASDDVYVYVRSNPVVGSYIAGFDVDQEHAFIAANEGDQWRGFLAEASPSLEAGRWYRLRITVLGERITLTIGNEELLAVDDAEVAQGSIRLLVPAQTRLEIDNFSVTAAE